MPMSWFYDRGARNDIEATATINAALDHGVTLFDTADVYGPFANEALLGQALAGRRDEAFIATKVGLLVDGAGQYHRNGSRAHIHGSCEASLQRLRTDRIDLYQLHRVDPAVPIEDSVQAMAELVTAGKVRAIGLSEVSVAELDRAAADRADRLGAVGVQPVDPGAGPQRRAALVRGPRRRPARLRPARTRLPHRRHSLARPTCRPMTSAVTTHASSRRRCSANESLLATVLDVAERSGATRGAGRPALAARLPVLRPPDSGHPACCPGDRECLCRHGGTKPRGRRVARRPARARGDPI